MNTYRSHAYAKINVWHQYATNICRSHVYAEILHYINTQKYLPIYRDTCVLDIDTHWLVNKLVLNWCAVLWYTNYVLQFATLHQHNITGCKIHITALCFEITFSTSNFDSLPFQMDMTSHQFNSFHSTASACVLTLENSTRFPKKKKHISKLSHVHTS